MAKGSVTFVKIHERSMKKVPVLIALLVIVVIVGFAYFRLVLSTSGTKPIYDAVPESAALIFEFKNFSHTKSKLDAALYAKDLQQATFVSRILNHLQLINEHFYINDYKPLQGNKIIATLHLTQLKEFNYLYLIEAGKIDRNQFKAMILAIDEKMKVKERTFKEESVYDITGNNGELFFTATKISGLLLISENASLVEEAIIQLKEKKSLLENEDFKKVKELAGGDSDVLLYMNFKNLIALEPLLTDANKSNLMKNISMFSEWMESDIMLEEKAIIINGYTLFTDSKKSWIAQLSGKPADSFTLPALMPDETALFMMVSNTNNEKYFNELKDNIEQSGKLKYINYFKEWTSDEWVFGMNEPLDKNWQNQIYLVVKNTDSLLCETKLSALQKLINNDTTTINTTAKKGQLNIADVLNDIYGKYLLPLNNPYYVVSGNYTFFANDSNTLNKVLEDINNEQTLSKNVAYVNFSKNISTTSNLYLYFNSAKLSELLQATVSDILLPSIQQNKTYQKFSPASIQFNFEENIFFTNAYINYKTDVEEQYKQLWKLQLDTTAATQAFYVTDHTTSDKEIVIQDELNQLYLINKAGTVVWKKPLKEKIVSTIHQVDFYNNKHLQYVFNTETELHVIDREGNYLPNFPLRLPDKATNGMMLAYYSEINQYRIFIACSDRVYGYELGGKALTGWNPKPKMGTITKPLQHYVFEGKDYIIAQNEEGTIYYFDRKGENRITPVKLKEPFTDKAQINIVGEKFQLTGFGKSGTVYHINLNGNIKELKFDDNITTSQFIYADINSDEKFEYLFAEKNKLVAYNDSFITVLELNLPAEINNNIFGFKNKGKYLLGMNAVEANKLLILDTEGNIFDDFVMNGITAFEIGAFNSSLKNIVISCDKTGMLVAYKLP